MLDVGLGAWLRAKLDSSRSEWDFTTQHSPFPLNLFYNESISHSRIHSNPLNLSIGAMLHVCYNSVCLPLAWSKGPLTLKFDRVTRAILKIDRRHDAYRHQKKYYRHDIGYFLNSTCDIGLF